MKRKVIILSLSIVLLTCFLGGCQSSIKLNPKKPVTLTMWHNYGGQMQKTMDMLIDEFNNTVGREHGIILNVTSISASKEQEEKLNMIANGDPGAPEMPDILTAYPKTAALLHEKELIAPLDGQFSKDELTAYIPQYIDEGKLSDGKLYVFPIAKSTEVLFVNRTLFDRFANQTGVTVEDLSTFEGIAAAAVKYYNWTDAKTPNVLNDGKTFFTADSWFNIALVGTAQLKSEFVQPERLLYDTAAYKRVWNFCMPGALNGSYAVYDGYSSDLAKTGDFICSTGSTAGILFYGDTITYADNRSEKVAYTILPYPTFESGEKIALQRGAGMIVKKSKPELEFAASVFLKWFTSPEINTRFISSTGYLPVTKKANKENIQKEIKIIENANIKQLLTAASKMYAEYTFIVAPNNTKFGAMSKDYEKRIKKLMEDGRKNVLGGADVNRQSEEMLKKFMK